MSNPILHITVKTDQHGNRPSRSHINSVARKFRRAIQDAGGSQVVVVTDDHVIVNTINEKTSKS